ncbi:hypothetical protein POM88_038612 [Heracleum sosnowskyi]|uniref:Uncharacterized protein n=1 Tax=Heracleum sosnowskyi TaxID=360622 RepID=A0AAD8H9W8_9APIA|nr:hypothetical protein POM88_038612 [Heracleum sosnowskyi]
MELAEVYRIQYEGQMDAVRGVIVCEDQENGYQYLYKDRFMDDVDVHSMMLEWDTFKSYKEADLRLISARDFPEIKDSDHIIPNTRIKSSIRAKDGFLLKFYMLGVVYQDVHFEFPIDRQSDLSAPLRETVLSPLPVSGNTCQVYMSVRTPTYELE